MHAAIYARVSTERQERDQTIDSQLAALRTWVQQQGYALLPEHLFTDEGYSGARLDRPGLDRLRDAARDGGFDVVGILSPDRLARKYAYRCSSSRSSGAWAVRWCSCSIRSPTT